MKNKSNRLINEKSPYLLQHAHNPVDWYSWGAEAFEKARTEDKPIFLSIGYSSCHWCHVMEKESFSDDEVANLLNDACISIKVDREERPDIDHACMAVSLIMNGSGGWPLNLFLTPDGKPFFAISYVPKRTSGQIPGLVDIVPRVKWLWLMQKQNVIQSADSILEALKKGISNQKGSCPGRSVAKEAFKGLCESFDPLWGGFADSPKFAMPHSLLFLLEYGKMFKEDKAFEMVERTLETMAMGGIRDHLGGGFARYSIDREWKVPHFEKMLYDQALLLLAYASAWEVTGREMYKNVAFDIASYVLRDLRSPQGAFYAAEDADSEGVEGRFYVWSEKEIREILPPESLPLFLNAYGIQKSGNYNHPVTGRRMGDNILALSAPIPQLAEKYEIDLQTLEKQLAASRHLLLDARNKRSRPHCDKKILTDWNGLMIAALAFAGRIFKEQRFIDGAQKATEYILSKAVHVEKGIYHSVVDGKGSVSGFLDDYAFLIWGLLELEEATGKPVYGERAVKLSERMDSLFYDENSGGYFMTSEKDELLFFRPLEAEDGAVVSGNSVAMMNLLRMHQRTGKKEHLQKARSIGAAFAQNVQQNPVLYTHFLTAVLDF
ncbi:thioredoxin domain-containing protein [Aminobacterium sp. MB27-C1]|uniref:thioredoxin domain-containing protein n=1 Tax=Aminobacterium sp. MB27-C1 TaxID=3070661 RepID=UPI001BCBA806|nr:thioredoxin domain-containing protein [Aminobacterium sp. MB27-C1]WMI71768.1 thioredoxin domain-containing protein [Aminobacterium sp. MB27-C1]